MGFPPGCCGHTVMQTSRATSAFSLAAVAWTNGWVEENVDRC